MRPDDIWHTVYRRCDHREAQRKEQDELHLLLNFHVARQDDGYGEEDKEKVGKNIAHSHGEQLCKALSAFAPWIGQHLPVVLEWLAFGKVRYTDRNKRGKQGTTNDLQEDFVGARPGGTGKTLEEFENCVF